MHESAIVLCGGRSTRMNFDKALLRFGNETLLERVVRITHTVAGDVVVVAAQGQDLPAVGRLLRDPVGGEGPLAGLVTGLAAVHGGRALLLACDMPLLVPALLRRLLDCAGDAEACVPVIDGVPMTTCAVYATSVAPIAARRLAAGRRSLRGLLDEVNVRWLSAGELADVDPELVSFRDCDTPEAYADALERVERAGR
jgi:molybdenum cofactor guanylyltransferase